MNEGITHILWDWNGTLLDDAHTGLTVMNALLARYHKPLLPDMAAYRAAFGFPVREYYARVGLDDALFEQTSHEWMALYLSLAPTLALREGARETLLAVRARGVRQSVLSASQRENLLAQMAPFGIAGLFDEVLGLSHIYATSKEAIGRAWLARSGARAERVLLVGDTLHDKQVADALGCQCLLLCGGHQDDRALRAAGCPVGARPDDALLLLAGCTHPGV